MKVLEKKERRLGEKLFLKGDRCSGPKCAAVRRSYPPGVHGKRQTGRGRGGSEFGLLMREKQKVRFLYGLDDTEVERYSRKAAAKRGSFAEQFIQLLESRLDTVVFRMGFAVSRRTARQLVRHGHILLNGKIATFPSTIVKKGDHITVKERTLKSPLMAHIEIRLKKYEPPKWIKMDANKKTGTVVGPVELSPAEFGAEPIKIREFYSR